MKSKSITKFIVAHGQPKHDINADTRDQKRTPSIMLHEGACLEENGWTPAQSFQVYGEEALKTLRDFINELLEEPKDLETYYYCNLCGWHGNKFECLTHKCISKDKVASLREDAEAQKNQ